MYLSTEPTSNAVSLHIYEAQLFRTVRERDREEEERTRLLCYA
jgi:hypothetical protein